MKKLLFTLSILAVLFTACDDDEPTPNPDPTPSSELSGDVTEDVTLDATVTYTLTGTYTVKAGATLTIPAGTTIKGAGVNGFQECLIVEQGGTIMAQGSANAPITFTSAKSSPAAGDWGGIIICGYAPISAESAGGTGSVETDTDIPYGGSDPDDDSGVLSYVKIEYTGARESGTSEHNGLTLYGVGSGTEINNIYVLDAADDGVEFFGGTVDVTNILVVNEDDDMFDVTQGWSGTLTNAYGIWEPGYVSTEDDPRGVEADGNLDGDYPTYDIQSTFAIDGLTIKNYSSYKMEDCIKVRRHATSTITNALVMGGSAKDLIDLTDGSGNASDESSLDVTYAGVMYSGKEVAREKDGATTNATVTFSDDNTGANEGVFAWTGYEFEAFSEDLEGAVTGETVLNAIVDYTLTGMLSVEDGGVLTIPAGTTIKGAGVNGFQEQVIVKQGGTILAEGTAKEPITFTSSSSTPAPGDWGGIILCGYAPISAESAGGTGSVETDTDIPYGGSDSNDNSGILSYVKIEYTGARESGTSEHNGLTLYGVGNGTTINNIYVFEAADDGVEFFGGTVDVENILVVNEDDDMFDVTQGWSGTLTNAYGIWEAGYTSTEDDPRGVESDGNLDGDYPTYDIQSNFTINGLTIVNNSAYEMEDCIKVRRFATATITNALITGGQAIDLIDLTDGSGLATDATSINMTYSDVTLSGSEVKREKDGNTTAATVNIAAGNSGASSDVFDWTGYSF
ncbi:hypothetical protein [uncultured Draconibacterium sp.]|uniref:hypothetical protein n=1 Tax=uncultured Draconibacterium sp. TaxID=1573823 RepID=UPI002AA90A42|nr:hypothetical protein [uncultured Draconibacterium sp.]